MEIILAFILINYLLLPGVMTVSLAILGLLYAKDLVNVPFITDPNDPTKVYKGYSQFFTNLSPGIVKIIERNKKFQRCIMHTPGHVFKGHIKELNIPTSDPEYWAPIEVAGKETHAIPLPDLNWSDSVFISYKYGWWLWKRIVYRFTGLVFSGLKNYQGVRIYPIEYFKEKKDGQGNLELIRKANYSDHFRVQDFVFYFAIASLDTRDKQPIQVIKMNVFRVINPFLLAYKTDEQWTSRIIGSLSAAANNFTRIQPLEKILAGDEEAIFGLEEAIMKAGKRFVDFGIELLSVDIPDRSIIDPEVRKKLGDVAIAEVDKKARKIRAEGEAEAIVTKAGAITSAGAAGAMVAEQDTRVRIVDAADGKTAIISVGGKTDRALLASIAKNTSGK